jgi:LysR family transcriptional regulator, glycine cleavage system transcriptional activator
LKRAGLDHIDARRGPHFSNAVLALEAAQSGQGVALARRQLIASRLREGSLVAPFDIGITSPSTYFFAAHEMIALRPVVQNFMRWLLAEAEAN